LKINDLKMKFLLFLLAVLPITLSAQNYTTDFSCDFDGSCAALSIASEKCVFRVFPNPTADILSIEPPPQYARVFDVSGHDVGDVRGVQDLPQGVYFLQLQNGDCRETRKIVKL
jgi:hypothetical protein